MNKPAMTPERVKSIKAAGAAVVVASASLVAFLHTWEGTGRTVYADKLAGGLPTACNGITKHVSPYPVVVGDVWSEARCAEVLSTVIEGDQNALAKCFKRPPTQNQFDAYSSHAHNFGVRRTCASVAMGLHNAGKPDVACLSLAFSPDGSPNWSEAGGKFVQGLHNRRKAEMNLCLTKDSR